MKLHKYFKFLTVWLIVPVLAFSFANAALAVTIWDPGHIYHMDACLFESTGMEEITAGDLLFTVTGIDTGSADIQLTALQGYSLPSGIIMEKENDNGRGWAPFNDFTYDSATGDVRINSFQFNITGSTGYTGVHFQIKAIAPVIMFDVSFLDWNGVELKTENVRFGSSATAPEDPIRKGYNFVGWDTDFTNVTEDLTVTALYEKIPVSIESYTVSYHPNGGLGAVPVDMSRYYPNDPVTLPNGTGLTKEGSTFVGWSLASGGTVMSDSYRMGNGDVTLFAVWEQGSEIPEIPKTGDETSVFGFSMLIAGLAFAAVTVYARKHLKKYKRSQWSIHNLRTGTL
jgi:uncharacterized repeat protein (TIGR02543 family)